MRRRSAHATKELTMPITMARREMGMRRRVAVKSPSSPMSRASWRICPTLSVFIFRGFRSSDNGVERAGQFGRAFVQLGMMGEGEAIENVLSCGGQADDNL